MEKDIKREALRQYFKYFKIWFIIAGILAVTDPYVAQALLRVALVRQNAPDHAAAEPAVFLLALCDAVFAALIIEPDDLFIVQDDHLSFLSCMKDVWFVFTCTDEMRGEKVARFAAIFLL